MNCAFICWRPYQVFNAVNMVMNNLEGTKNNSDIFVQRIPALETIVERLVESNLFKNVYLFDENNRGDGTGVTKWTMFKIRIRKTVDFLFPKRALVRNCLFKTNQRDYYDKILSSGWISFNTELININPKSKVIMFEDGLGNYIENDLDMLPTSQKIYFNFMNRFFHKGLFSFSVESRYLYKPELITSNIRTRVNELPLITDNVYRNLCYLFDFNSDNIYKKNKIIYLDQPLKSSRSSYSVDSILKYLSKKDDFVYRRHPLQVRRKMEKFEDLEMPMWELVSSQFSNATVLISPYSTALLSPYLIYGIKPVIIFTYKMCLEEASAKRRYIDRLVKKIKPTYNNIFTPKTKEEFKSIIERLSYV